MSNGKRRVFSVEFRRRAVAMLETHSGAEIAAELGIAESTLFRWKPMYGKVRSTKGIVRKHAVDLEAENRQLQQAQEEVEILKKSIALFV